LYSIKVFNFLDQRRKNLKRFYGLDIYKTFLNFLVELCSIIVIIQILRWTLFFFIINNFEIIWFEDIMLFEFINVVFEKYNFNILGYIFFGFIISSIAYRSGYINLAYFTFSLFLFLFFLVLLVCYASDISLVLALLKIILRFYF
jgi:hypothetical protein